MAPSAGVRRAAAADHRAARRRAVSTYDEPPAFCCCEFVDRHGRSSHLSDLSYLDRYLTCAAPTSELCADLDDRCRLPMHSGAIYLGVEGAVPLVALPMLFSAASRSLRLMAVLLLLAPPVLAACHRRAWRQRRRSSLFVSLATTTTVCAYVAFTLVVAEHVWFGWWLLTTVALGVTLSSASAVRSPPPAPAYERRPLAAPGDGGGSSAGSGEDGSAVGEEAEEEEEEAFECALSGARVVGYDHYCVWVGACIGSHNHADFLIGLLALLAFAAPPGALAAARLPYRGVHPAPSAELLLVVGAVATWICVGALLASQFGTIARGLTGHEARRLSRRGEALPPCGGARAAARRVWLALCGNPAWRRSHGSTRGGPH